MQVWETPDLGGTVALPRGLMTQHSQPLIPDLGAGGPRSQALLIWGGAEGFPSTIGMVGVPAAGAFWQH